MLMADVRPNWRVDGRDWPNREHSRFVPSGGLTWHVQEWGEGPSLLLLHGTGAATHSFRDLAPALAERFRVLMPDLPGHGFTGMPSDSGLSLAGMAGLCAALIPSTAFVPEIAIGHSAGAAILVEMALRGMIRPKAIIAINGALRPMRGAAVFSPLAKLLFVNPLAPRLFAWRAGGRDATRRLLEGTGSTLDADGIALYERLFRKPGHVAATLGMMANWDLNRLQRDIPKLQVPLTLIAAAHDRAVPPQDAREIAARAPLARVVTLDYGGHLVHEEQPDRLARLIEGIAADVGLFGCARHSPFVKRA